LTFPDQKTFLRLNPHILRPTEKKIAAAVAHWVRAMPFILQVAIAAGALGQMASAPPNDLLPSLTRWLSGQTRSGHPDAATGTCLAAFLRRERPDIYDRRALFPMDAPSLSRYVAELGPYLPAMHTLERRCLEQQPKITEALRHLFPDFDPARVRVSLMVSLFRFDAKIPHDQPNQLWLGLDGIAKLHGSNCRIGVLLAHENFHLYHFQVNPQPNRGESVPLYRQIWQEGLACYASHLLNPDASTADVLLDPDLAANGPRYVPTLARALLDDLEADDDSVTARYLSYHRATGALPPRMGYLVGYEIVAACAARKPLPELVRLRGNALLRVMQREAGVLARGR
jgi:Predicted Zn-dependent protease (DUF2268)